MPHPPHIHQGVTGQAFGNTGSTASSGEQIGDSGSRGLSGEQGGNTGSRGTSGSSTGAGSLGQTGSSGQQNSGSTGSTGGGTAMRPKALSELNILVIGHNRNLSGFSNALDTVDALKSGLGTLPSASVVPLISFNVLDSIYTQDGPTPLAANQFLTTLKDPKWDYILYEPYPVAPANDSQRITIVGNEALPIIFFNSYSYIIESVLAIRHNIDPSKTVLILGSHINPSDENNSAIIHRLAYNTESLATSSEGPHGYLDVIKKFQKGEDLGMLPYSSTTNYRNHLTFAPPGEIHSIKALGTSTECRQGSHLLLLAADPKNLNTAPCNLAATAKPTTYDVRISRDLPFENLPAFAWSSAGNVQNLAVPIFKHLTRENVGVYPSYLSPMAWQAQRDSSIFPTVEAFVRWFNYLQKNPARAQLYAPNFTTQDDITTINAHVSSCIAAIMASAYYTVYTNRKALLTPTTNAELLRVAKTYPTFCTSRSDNSWTKGDPPNPNLPCGASVFSSGGCQFQDLLAAYQIGFELVIEHQYAGDFATITKKQLYTCGKNPEVLQYPN